MPVTAEIIKQSDALKELPENQVEAFVTLANNIFKEDIDTHTGTSKRRWEEDVKGLFGLEKPQPNMPAHEYLKWAAAEQQKAYEAKIEEAKKLSDPAEKEALERKIQALQNELKDAGLKGSELLRSEIDGYKQKLKDFETLEKQLKSDFSSEKKKLESEISAERQRNLLLQVGFEKSEALVGVEFNPAYAESVRNDLIEARWNAILAKAAPAKEIDENGNLRTIWRDKDGNILRNPKNNRLPFTTKELLMEGLQDILKTQRIVTGSGTNGGQNGGNAIDVDLTSARSQVEADEIIERQILGMGIAKGTTQFTEKKTAIRKENESLFRGPKALPLMSN